MVTVLLIACGRGSTLKNTFTVPVLPGSIGALGHSVTLVPQHPCTSLTISGLTPSFLISNHNRPRLSEISFTVISPRLTVSGSATINALFLDCDCAEASNPMAANTNAINVITEVLIATRFYTVLTKIAQRGLTNHDS